MLLMRLLSEGGEGVNTELQWLLVAGLAFFLLTILVGWVSSRKQNQVEVKHEAVKPKKKS